MICTVTILYCITITSISITSISTKEFKLRGKRFHFKIISLTGHIYI